MSASEPVTELSPGTQVEPTFDPSDPSDPIENRYWHPMELRASNWEFVRGRSATVRLGTSKWGYLNPGDDLVFVCPEDPTRCATARVTKVTKGVFTELHDAISCHHAGYSIEKLIRSMTNAYGDAFTIDSVVTVIEFELR